VRVPRAHDLVEAETHEPSDHLLLGNLLAVALRTDVGCHRFFALIGNLSIRSNFEAQRWRETFARGIARLAIDNRGDHALATPQHLEAAYLLVDVFALRRPATDFSQRHLRTSG